MISAFRHISLRYFATHRLRTALTAAGIGLGVAIMIAVRLMHGSASLAYARTIERFAGKAVIEISNGETGVPEELLEEARVVPGVAAAIASVQGFAALPQLAGERLYIMGIDLLADQELRDYELDTSEIEVEDPLVFLAQPDSIAITWSFAARHDLQLGDRLSVLTPEGAARLTIRALLDTRTGPASTYGGRLAVMDVFAAQRLLRLDGRFSQIDIGITEGVDLETVEAALTGVVAGRGKVERTQMRGEALEKLLTANRYATTATAMLAILVGLYLIFNTMMIAVVQRRRDLGILRSIGMRRREVMRLIGLEALLLAAVGSAAGVPAGLALAHILAPPFAAGIGSIYVPIDAPEIRLQLIPVLWGIGLGFLSAFIAAAAPAREAAGIHPLEVLRTATVRDEPARKYTGLALLGLACIAAALGMWAARDALPLNRNVTGSLAMVGLLAGLSLAVPIVIRAFGLRAEPVIGAILGPLGALASRNIVTHIRRVAVTCAAFLVSLAGALAIATALWSLQNTLSVWFDLLWSDIDLVIASGAKPLSPEATVLPASLGDEIAAMPEVDRVDPVRIARVAYGGSLTTVFGSDARFYRDGVRRLRLLDGDLQAALEALLRGEAAVVDQAFAQRFRVWAGDTLVLTTPSGEARLPVAGIYFDLSFADLGMIRMDRALYRRLWRDDTVNFFAPVLRPGADRERVIEDIRARWGAQHALFIMTVGEFRQEVQGMLDQALGFAYPLIAVSIAIALLGVVNALLATVLDRFRQIGVLRAIGATRRQVSQAIIIEAAIIGLLGGTIGVVTGSVLGYLQVEILLRGLLGMSILYRYPAPAVGFAFVAAIVLAAAAGWLPGRAAARLRVTAALRAE